MVLSDDDKETSERRRIDVFFYGLFMDQHLLLANGVHAENPRVTSLSGFGIYVGQRATLIPDPMRTAHGVVMALTHDEIERLYSDPTLRDYKPEALICELRTAEKVAALCFNLLIRNMSIERNRDYARKLAEIAQRLTLSNDCVLEMCDEE